MWPGVYKATKVNSTLSFLLSFYYRSTVNGNTRCSLACLPRYHAATRQDMALSFFIPPYRFTSRTCYRQHCVYSFHKSYARGYYTTPTSILVLSWHMPQPVSLYSLFECCFRNQRVSHTSQMVGECLPTNPWPWPTKPRSSARAKASSAKAKASSAKAKASSGKAIFTEMALPTNPSLALADEGH